MPIQITSVNRTNDEYDNPYLSINSLVWIDDHTKNQGITTRDVLFDWINDNGTAYVVDEEGNKAKLLTATTQNGYKYVKTAFDETQSDKLLSLLASK
ncbi:DUF3892 domain-containing protein [Mucilaginibacter sp. SP1R1]|uniref:DUF3892 domain-containing protein n=1 Tax=Mucilaginibacter sp. SP1R1 TaxID=2723091 RepID=UPI00161DF18D|nr:DUF3892 domain-containing protein [Mucilaginibacter sp. SP1R1]MBB6149188.1 hypothetical protein [Mucilaginibacter sp. SP1R1]